MSKKSKASRPTRIFRTWLYTIIFVVVILAGIAVYYHYTPQSNSAVYGNNLLKQIESQTYKIPELSIQMTLPEGLEGLEYGVEENAQDSRVLYANFVTAGIIKKNGGDTRCSIGTIARWTSDPGELGSSARAILVGEYYYSYTNPQQPCINADATDSMQQQQSGLLQSAFDTISEL